MLSFFFQVKQLFLSSLGLLEVEKPVFVSQLEVWFEGKISFFTVLRPSRIRKTFVMLSFSLVKSAF